jgi:polyhydroxybutyrate depolymerase
VLLLAAACTSTSDEAPKPPPDTVTFGGDRPTTLVVPASYDHSVPTPLLLVLHGYGATGQIQANYFGFVRLAQDEGFLLLAPDGTPERGSGSRFWNATDACCDFGGAGIDDVAYLTGLVREVEAEYNVDPRRIYVIGHSNGGFMANRLACDAPGLFAAAFSLAGAFWSDASRCSAAAAVSFVQAHGTLDDTIRFDGGSLALGAASTPRPYPSAETTASHWSRVAGCSGPLVDSGARAELDAAVDGEETQLWRATGCPAGRDVELWRMERSGHIPGLGADFAAAVWRWFLAHAKR